MKAKTELLLYTLLFGASKLARPTLRSMTSSFEEWAYGEGFWRQIAELERREFLERHSKRAPNVVASRIYRLTEAGRLRALGGRDPEVQWKRKWDGRWRMVLFDIPQREHVARTRLGRLLREGGFGRLQNSVWVSPDALDQVVQQLSNFGDNVNSLITLEARPCSGESDAAIVAASWHFDRINSLYEAVEEVLRESPGRMNGNAAERERLRRWSERERAAWLQAVKADPLLPEELLPEGYLGKRVWEARKRKLGGIAADK